MLPLCACCCIPLLLPLAYVNKPKAVATEAGERYRVESACSFIPFQPSLTCVNQPKSLIAGAMEISPTYGGDGSVSDFPLSPCWLILFTESFSLHQPARRTCG